MKNKSVFHSEVCTTCWSLSSGELAWESELQGTAAPLEVEVGSICFYSSTQVLYIPWTPGMQQQKGFRQWLTRLHFPLSAPYRHPNTKMTKQDKLFFSLHPIWIMSLLWLHPLPQRTKSTKWCIDIKHCFVVLFSNNVQWFNNFKRKVNFFRTAFSHIV